MAGSVFDYSWLNIGKQRRSFPKDVQVGVVGIDDGLAGFGAWFQNAFGAHELDVVRHGVPGTLQTFRGDGDRYDGIAFQVGEEVF